MRTFEVNGEELLRRLEVLTKLSLLAGAQVIGRRLD